MLSVIVVNLSQYIHVSNLYNVMYKLHRNKAGKEIISELTPVPSLESNCILK